MSLFKRISTTLVSRLDAAVGEIENHDALIEASIREQRKKIAAAKVQLGRIQKLHKQSLAQAAERENSALRWQDRARGEVDDERAMQCLARRKRDAEEASRLQGIAAEYARSEQRLLADVRQCEEQLKSIHQKHALMRARQSSAEARSAVSSAGTCQLETLETSFERWESRITESELLLGDGSEVYCDELEDSYLAGETNDALRAELDALRKDSAGKEMKP